jgi:3-phosphoshikimate 1-carboxyvinyltransferase
VALPDLIEIVPPIEPVSAEITVPGSKSITNRTLVLAALAKGKAVLRGALWSEDTQVMVQCLERLGFQVNVESDPQEICNRSITLDGLGGRIPRGGTVEKPLELFVGNAGTAARFLTALVCLGQGVYRLQGVPRMHERPQSALFEALRQLGYLVSSPNDRLPALIHGAGPLSGSCQVSIAESSQFASALLLCAHAGGWQVRVVGENSDESPYIEMTRQLRKAFPSAGGMFDVEPDASSGSYLIAADSLLRWNKPLQRRRSRTPGQQVFEPARAVAVVDWPTSGWQIDAAFPKYLPLPEEVSRERDLGDSIMTAIVLAPWAEHPVRFTQLGRLRLQECERVAALRCELTKCGARVLEMGDSLTVYPSPLHGATVETYDDHRMAMCFSILGLKVAGIKIKNPACVKKTFPNFYQKLARPAPAGLGATIREASSQRELGWEELFAG